MVYLIQRRKNDVTRIIVASMFIIFMLLANIQIFSNFNHNTNNTLEQYWSDREENPESSAADPYLTDYYITGSGSNQDVRIYALNNSNSNANNVGSFNIPSMSTTDTTYLSYGNFNFTFQNNFTTDYIIENTGALYANDFIKFTYDEDASLMNINTGTNLDAINFNKLVDNNPSTYIRLSSSGGILNFTIDSSFTNTIFDGPVFNVDFNRSLILGLISTFSGSLNNDVFLTLKMYNIYDSMWVNVTDRLFINSSLGTQQFEDRIINENLNYINGSDVNQLQFYVQKYDSSDFILTLREFKLVSTYGFDLPITENKQLALEFDLKGISTTVNGFYAWIRTLDLAKAANAELNISLYKANSTIPRTQSYLIANNLKPNNSQLIDSKIIGFNEYHGDSLTYFGFNLGNTQKLNLYNYFIVIKSNRTDLVYSLVTLPRQTYGDPDNRIDHKLLLSEDSGSTWNIAKKQVPSVPLYLSEQLDAAAFKLNVTRAYMPSDFINPYDSEDTLKIQNIPLNNSVIAAPPYDVSSSLTWGLGQWTSHFTPEIVNDGSYNFPIVLTWNKSVIKGFEFNVSYTVRAYWIENANSYYKVSYDTTPEWQLNFTLNLADPNLNEWTFQEVWFVYPNDYAAHNLTNPNYDDIYREVINNTGGERSLVSRPSFDYTAVPYYIINGISGQYSLALNSSNLIYNMHSYINYNDILWETNGFMYGDNISVSLDVQRPDGEPPTNGNANVVLFYPNNKTKVPGAEMNSGVGVIVDDYLKYDFNNLTILDVNQATPLLGNYYLGFFWENGSAIGCQKLKLYIDSYDVNLQDCFYEENLDRNILVGIVDRVYESYSILIGTVNVTDDRYRPGFFAINKTNINKEFIHKVNNEEIPILVETFVQNETILNPNEDIRIGTRIHNLHDFLDLKVKVKVQLVSFANEKWIIAEKTTGIQTLKPSIDPNGDDTKDFFVDLTIPDLLGNGIWKGVNAPVRKGGVTTKFTIYFEYGGKSHEVGTYKSADTSLLVNSTQSEFEGYLIALKKDKQVTSASILKPFKRDECLYLPNKTTFIVNIYDKNYVSSYNDFISSFSLKINSKFSEISTIPHTPIYGQKFNISSVLSTEFGDRFPAKNVSLLYFDNNAWQNFSTQMTDENGTTNFEIDTLLLPHEDEFTFRLSWQGDQYTLANSQNITVTMFRARNNISLRITKDVDQLFKNTPSAISITLSNIGDSELKVLIQNITIQISPTLSYSIEQINFMKLAEFKPNDITTIIVKIDISSVDQISFSMTIDARNEQTQENVVFQKTVDFTIYDAPLDSLLISYFALIMIGIFVIVWAISLLYIRRTIRKIETPLEEPIKPRPRRGKYVSVRELPLKVQEEKTEEIREVKLKKIKKKKAKKEKVEEEEEEKTDLDSLLEEKGLKD
ncbi:MAG: hypothetical protein EAX91_02310 [Candidatus Lokiarchaeota archaeon]|nr:hypothetical protein [Candidatus Lokiarchaeota archaeon]